MIKVFGKHDPGTIQQMEQTMADGALYGSVMSDGHVGYSMPIGGVAAYDNKVSVAGVGVDVACGNCAVMLDLHIDAMDDANLRFVGEWIQENIGMGMRGQVNKSYWAPKDHPIFDDEAWELIPREFRSTIFAKARNQLGTIGGGNHYIDIFADEQGRIWIGVHFGSRGFGYKVANAFVSMSQGGAWDGKGDWANKPSLLNLDSTMGSSYWALMHLAGNYAYSGRMWVCNTIARVMGAKIKRVVHNHHNFAWREKHFGQDLIVVRKGATPAWPGQEGFVGGSMGDDAVILHGTREYLTDDPIATDQQDALFSTVHGAGRVRSRTATRGKVNRKKGIITKPGLVSLEEVREWINGLGVLVYGADIDESPQAYRRLRHVLADQCGTIKVEHMLRPLLVAMAPGYSGKNPFLIGAKNAD